MTNVLNIILANAKNNWIGANVDKVINGILHYFG